MRSTSTRGARSLGAVVLLLGACTGGSGAEDESSTSGILPPLDGSSSDGAASSDGSSGSTSAATTTADSGSSSDDGVDPCLFCDAPNQQCVDDQCVTTCQGQLPDPCGPAQVCDVISGECRDPATACTLAGESEPCDGQQCGPGSVCDGQGACIPVAPCGDVACLATGECWGTFCACERTIDCTPPAADALNGPFSVQINGLEFADDCTAWMVTLRSGTDYVRRLLPDGTLTEWAGVSNLNMGEVKVRKVVTPPAGIVVGRPDRLAKPTRPPGSPASPVGPADLVDAPAGGVDGLGEVAITYTCCASCGCFTDPPQGVARLVEDDPANPLPLVIEAVVTQGTGPFGAAVADSGPFGLTWGIDRVLYVGNSTANGDIVTADLDMGTQSALATLTGRITAGAPVSAAHLLFAIEGGQVYRFNVLTLQAELLVELGDDVTSLSHDAFDGRVYAGLRSLDVVVLEPRTGLVEPFDVMPGRGRVTVSPNGQLWFSPVAYLEPNPISAWDLPDAF